MQTNQTPSPEQTTSVPKDGKIEARHMAIMFQGIIMGLQVYDYVHGDRDLFMQVLGDVAQEEVGLQNSLETTATLFDAIEIIRASEYFQETVSMETKASV
jgi:hypothetical protein